MHAVIEENLEELLDNTNASGRAALDHLVSCKECAMELERMKQIAHLFPTLRSEHAIEPAASFTARVMTLIEHRRPSFWESIFEATLETTLETTMTPAFFRRVAFASLLVLATLGGYMAVTDSEFRGVTPELILAAERNSAADRNAPDSEDARNQDRALFMTELRNYLPDATE